MKRQDRPCNVQDEAIARPVAVALSQVSKRYMRAGRDQWIFKGIEARISQGELLVLLGRSGSGKSTLLNLISGIDNPSSGEIAFGELSLTALSESERTRYRRKHIGFVFQAFNLIPTLSVSENLQLPLELNRFPRRSQASRIEHWLAEVGLEDKANEFPDRLSGGEQQRVAIARALVHDPDIILADEPTGNLDLETGRKILDILECCVRKSGKTLIMATHSEEVVGRADRILSIRDFGLSGHCG
ncbi:MAG: ABC transporter ATP-binding protein [Gammaproteobacteria bacterium]